MSGVIPHYDHKNQLRAIRNANGLSQTALASVSGVAPITISCLERLKSCTFKALAEHLDWDVAELTRAMLGPAVEEPVEVQYIKVSVRGPKPIRDEVLMAQAAERGIDPEKVRYWIELYADPVVIDGARYWTA